MGRDFGDGLSWQASAAATILRPWQGDRAVRLLGDQLIKIDGAKCIAAGEAVGAGRGICGEVSVERESCIHFAVFQMRGPIPGTGPKAGRLGGCDGALAAVPFCGIQQNSRCTVSFVYFADYGFGGCSPKNYEVRQKLPASVGSARGAKAQGGAGILRRLPRLWRVRS